MNLDGIRKNIDDMDAEIVRLLDKRAAAARQAEKAKKILGLPMRNPDREAELLERLPSLSDGSMPARSLAVIFRAIMAESLALQTSTPPAGNGACAGKGGGSPTKRDVPAEVVENVRIAPGFMRMRVRISGDNFTFAPGQFFQLRIKDGGSGPFLRRPFAPSDIHPDGFSFVYAVVGAGTAIMADLPPGAPVFVLAPLGNAYTSPPRGATVLLAGGGCGAPSLVPLAKRLGGEGVKTVAVVGARSASVLLEHELFGGVVDRLIVSTDDGSAGHCGNVLDALAAHAAEADEATVYDRIYACGPAPMLRAVATMAMETGIECEVSLEERMACGFGACMGCVVPLRDGKGGSAFKRVCHDGPIFNARDLVWAEMR